MKDGLPPKQTPDLAFPDAILSWTNHWIALNKPSGLLSRPGPGHSTSALAQLERWLREKAPGSPAPGVVHRLDRDTSGVLIFSLGPAGHRALTRGFAERRIRKEYLALVHGCPRPRRGRIDLALRRNSSGLVVPDPRGVPASTRYRTLRSYPEVALLEVQPLTGRMHQIRVHLAARGTPVIGDHTYGLRGGPRGGRLCLHARRLELPLDLLGPPGSVRPVLLDLPDAEHRESSANPEVAAWHIIEAPEPVNLRAVLLRLTGGAARE